MATLAASLSNPSSLGSTLRSDEGMYPESPFFTRGRETEGESGGALRGGVPVRTGVADVWTGDMTPRSCLSEVEGSETDAVNREGSRRGEA